MHGRSTSRITLAGAIAVGFGRAPWLDSTAAIRFDRAYDVARLVKDEYGAAAGVDTVTVRAALAPMPQITVGTAAPPSGGPDRVEEFFFYPAQLTARERPRLGVARSMPGKALRLRQGVGRTTESSIEAVMRRSCWFALALLLLPAPLRAQRAVPVGVAAPADVRPMSWRLPPAAERRPRAWPYVAVGAAVGAVATAGGIALALAHDKSECICSPIAFVPVVAAGAALGAAGGYVVYRVRF